MEYDPILSSASRDVASDPPPQTPPPPRPGVLSLRPVSTRDIAFGPALAGRAGPGVSEAELSVVPGLCRRSLRRGIHTGGGATSGGTGRGRPAAGRGGHICFDVYIDALGTGPGSAPFLTCGLTGRILRPCQQRRPGPEISEPGPGPRSTAGRAAPGGTGLRQRCAGLSPGREPARSGAPAQLSGTRAEGRRLSESQPGLPGRRGNRPRHGPSPASRRRPSRRAS